MSDEVAATVRLTEGLQFEAEAGSGHTLTMDASAEAGGQDSGFRPLELLLIGLGGCTAMDVVPILRKMKQQVDGYEIHVSGKRVTEHPRVFETIEVEHVLRGRNLDPRKVERAINLSMKVYCSAAAMLGKAADIRATYRIVELED